MMCDTNWCTFCDSAISPYSDSLYCSHECLKQDALLHHPMLGYDFSDLGGFPHVNIKSAQPTEEPSYVVSNPNHPHHLAMTSSASSSPIFSACSSFSSSSSSCSQMMFSYPFDQITPSYYLCDKTQKSMHHANVAVSS
ncbi:uncharacterized protein BYT42DRAFT_557106 [Radiomyces spectabilis]|uniref:uncharacterized protein n=1 Tax=Radiomyces spectabilis TaxID=64574 RepID=UPI002220B3FA|nr:uncharacterized protein BYT42DRAFT_557106 [Radiomyces spectabilis]KAI8391503.1 hypothetical protein BYT42DRAFT_557106 [Radiomyces spectabilis]